MFNFVTGNCHNIKSDIMLPVNFFYIKLGSLNYFFLLGCVYKVFRKTKGTAISQFYFYKNEDLVFVHNQINFSTTSPIIFSHQFIPSFCQIISSEVFTFHSQSKIKGHKTEI